MSGQLQQPGQRPFSTPDLNQGNEVELAEAASKYFTYTGEFYLDERGVEPILKHKMQLSLFPNWVGNLQRRVMRLEGDLLILSPEMAFPIHVCMSLCFGGGLLILG